MFHLTFFYIAFDWPRWFPMP